MKKELGKRIGSLLLCAALLSGNISADVYAVTAPENDMANVTASEREDAGEAIAGKDGSESISGNDPEEGEISETVSENDMPDAQYHFIEEDSESVAKWLALYCPNSFEELLTHGGAWWDALYDYEREYADFLVGLIVELPEDVYDGQTIEECIRILENGVDANVFFAGTVFQGLALEDLERLRDAGVDLEDLTIIGDAEGNLEDFGESVPEQRSRKAALFAVNADDAEGGEEIKEEVMAKVSIMTTGYSGTGHGLIHRITLGGAPALCISFGKSCRNTFLYHAGTDDYKVKTGALGYFAQNANNSGAEYVACQIAAWLFMENENLSKVQVESRTQAMVNITSPISLARMQDYVWKFYSGAKSSQASYYEYSSDNKSAQVLITGMAAAGELHTTVVKPADPENPEPPESGTCSQAVEVTYSIVMDKKDRQTNVGLEGCVIEISENGAYLDTVTTDENGCAEYLVTKTAEFSVDYDGESVTEEQAWDELEAQIAAFAATRYTYSVREATAPEGYVWEANEQSAVITGEATAGFHLTNERTLGAVELIKFDTESESGTAQGDAVLDGAVYGIYAAEEIKHQDKKSEPPFRKDALVQTAVIGKTPERDADGHILNTDGSRHIDEPEKEVAYADTPGKTLFGDLELGSYYVKEIAPSEGYMFDETVYPVTFTYKDQMVKIEKRNETAGQAENELTADDGSASDAIYSGDYVNKQGFQLVKTADNAWQTELEAIAGAGFSVYLISELSGVKSGEITPIGETWTEDDIMTFYDYDFTGEKTATVYKRTEDHEAWTEGDRKWLTAGEHENEYYVDEMLTDGDGYIESPELPYGAYVVAETTTPEDYKCAKPFIVRITGDGGVLYTDNTKQTVEKTYAEGEKIRYGDHKMTKEREGRILQKQRIINNTITKTFLRILKTDKEVFDTLYPDDITQPYYFTAEEFVRGTVLKEGAAYRLKCATLPKSREALLALNWKFDGDGYLSFYDQNTRELCGTEETPFTTKFLRKNGVIQDCYITLPQQIPIGKYELEELTAPEGFVVNGSEQAVSDCSTERVNQYEIKDAPYPKMIFVIDNGTVYPDGQMGTNKYALADEYGNITVTMLQENQEQKGIVEITKHGEQLSGIHEDSETLLEKLKAEPFREIKNAAESGHRDLVFEYEDAPVEGAVFAIFADEDIYTQEVRKDLLDSYQADKKQYLCYQKDDLVATITTDRNGWGYAANLYIGKYRIAETVAGDGFVLNTKETPFEITAQEQTVSFDIYTADYKNERQTLEIAVEKKDYDSAKPLAGAVYGLYAKEDVMVNIEKDAGSGKWVVKDEPEVLFQADTLIATCITDKEGQGIFDEDLPLGKYYVRELEAPLGYLTAPDDVLVNGSYDSMKGGQNVEKQVYHPVLKNRKTQTVITKQDLTDGKEIAGAVLEVKEIETDSEGVLNRDADGSYVTKTVDSWVSKEEELHYFYRDAWGYLTEIADESKLPAGEELLVKNGHLINGLKLDTTYILSEQLAPQGYHYAEDILFKLVQEKEDGGLTGTSGLYVLEDGVWQRAEEDILVMYDEQEALKIEKSTISMTQYGDIYQYRVDELKNELEQSLEQFTMTDSLPEGIYLTELWTGTYNQDLCYDVEYMTNKSADWVCLESGLSTKENHHFQIPEALQTAEEHITEFRLCFGTVGGLFEALAPPVYMTYVSPDAEEVILNKIELTAECNGKKLWDKAETRTVLYLRSLSAYRGRGGGKPLYEFVEVPEDGSEEEVLRIRRMIENADEAARQQELANAEDADVPLGLYRNRGVGTGDDTPVLILTETAIMAFAAFVILWFFGRRRKG